jgi:hypothetical protein
MIHKRNITTSKGVVTSPISRRRHFTSRFITTSKGVVTAKDPDAGTDGVISMSGVIKMSSIGQAEAYNTYLQMKVTALKQSRQFIVGANQVFKKMRACGIAIYLRAKAPYIYQSTSEASGLCGTDMTLSRLLMMWHQNLTTQTVRTTYDVIEVYFDTCVHHTGCERLF